LTVAETIEGRAIVAQTKRAASADILVLIFLHLLLPSKVPLAFRTPHLGVTRHLPNSSTSRPLFKAICLLFYQRNN
jgi:hypothetical protein